MLRVRMTPRTLGLTVKKCPACKGKGCMYCDNDGEVPNGWHRSSWEWLWYENRNGADIWGVVRCRNCLRMNVYKGRQTRCGDELSGMISIRTGEGCGKLLVDN